MRPYFLLLLLIGGCPAWAQPATGNEYSLKIKRATSEVKIDGILDDGPWAEAESAGGFWLNAPSDNSPAGNPTIVKAT